MTHESIMGNSSALSGPAAPLSLHYIPLYIINHQPIFLTTNAHVINMHHIPLLRCVPLCVCVCFPAFTRTQCQTHFQTTDSASRRDIRRLPPVLTFRDCGDIKCRIWRVGKPENCCEPHLMQMSSLTSISKSNYGKPL